MYFLTITGSTVIPNGPRGALRMNFLMKGLEGVHFRSRGVHILTISRPIPLDSLSNMLYNVSVSSTDTYLREVFHVILSA